MRLSISFPATAGCRSLPMNRAPARSAGLSPGILMTRCLTMAMSTSICAARRRWSTRFPARFASGELIRQVSGTKNFSPARVRRHKEERCVFNIKWWPLPAPPGIGRQTAEQAAREGARLLLIDRSRYVHELAATLAEGAATCWRWRQTSNSGRAPSRLLPPGSPILADWTW